MANDYFTAKRSFRGGNPGRLYKAGETYKVGPHDPKPEDSAAKHCCFADTEGEALQSFIDWKNGGCKD